MNETELIDRVFQPDDVFKQTIRRCPPSATATRAVLEILSYYEPDTKPDEDLRQENGELLPQAAAFTALRVVKELLGPNHPFCRTMEHDLREEWKR